MGILLKEWQARFGLYFTMSLMTLISIPLAIAFELVRPTVGSGAVMDHIREVNLACAGIAGTALALILTLSITPVQKAGEAFSQAILKLYHRDRALSFTFVLLSFTCIMSLFVGTGWNPGLSPHAMLAIQFLLMGLSLDALRYFHTRTINLLLPKTAIELVLRDCRKNIEIVRRHTEKIARIMRFDRGSSAGARYLRATLYNRTALATTLKRWIHELDEFAHKATVRGETLTATSILDALGEIGNRYADARKASIFIVPDMNYPFAGGQTEVSQLLDHIYDTILGISQHAAKLENERVVQRCVRVLALMALAALDISVESPPPPNWRRAPLVHSPVFFLSRSTETALAAGMQDALLEAVRHLRQLMNSVRIDVDTRNAEGTAMDALFKIALGGTIKGFVVAYPAVEALLSAALYDLLTRPRQGVTTLRSVLRYIQQITPFEVQAEQAGARLMQTFPPYDQGAETGLMHQFAAVAQAVVPPDQSQYRGDPFGQLLSMAKALSEHYREMSGIGYDRTLLIKWILDSMTDICRVHVRLIVEPPAGTERYIGGVEESLRNLIWTYIFFFRREHFNHHAEDASNGLANVGMELLRVGKLELARGCGMTIAAIATNCSLADFRGRAIVADHLRNLEILARAAEALGQKEARDQFRAMIVKPPTLDDDAWNRHMEDFGFRLGHLEDELDRFRWDDGLHDDPISLLRRICAETGADQEEEE
jgi:hypothetical protein